MADAILSTNRRRPNSEGGRAASGYWSIGAEDAVEESIDVVTGPLGGQLTV